MNVIETYQCQDHSPDNIVSQRFPMKNALKWQNVGDDTGKQVFRFRLDLRHTNNPGPGLLTVVTLISWWSNLHFKM